MGKNIVVKGQKHSTMVKQQKQYLKGLKIDPMVTFHSRWDGARSAATEQAKTDNSPYHHEESPYRRQLESRGKMNTVGSYDPYANSSQSKLNTVILDGRFLKPATNVNKNLSPYKRTAKDFYA